MILWNKPDGGHAVDQYYAEWFQLGSDQRSGYKYVKHVGFESNYSFVITNLPFDTQYNVLVVAKNSEGYGPYSLAHLTTGKWYIS